MSFKLLESEYDLVVLGSSFSSLLSSFYAKKQGLSVLYVERAGNMDTGLLPLLSVENKDFKKNIFDFLDISLSKEDFKQFPLGIIISGQRFQFSKATINEELEREFPEKKNILDFIHKIIDISKKIPAMWIQESFLINAGIKKSSFKAKSRLPFSVRGVYDKNIDFFYNKYFLSKRVRNIFNMLIFAATGVIRESYPALDSIRILSSLLCGVSFYDSNKNINNLLFNDLKKKIDTRKNINPLYISNINGLYRIRLDNFEAYVNTKNIISDYIDESFMNNVEKSAKKIYPYSVVFEIESNFIPSEMSPYTIYIDEQRYEQFSFNDIYIIEKEFVKEGKGILKISQLKVNSSYKKADFVNKAESILKKIIPLLCDDNYKKIKQYVEKDTAIYDTREDNFICPKTKYKNIYLCGREYFPFLGEDGNLSSALNAVDRMIKAQ